MMEKEAQYQYQNEGIKMFDNRNSFQSDSDSIEKVREIDEKIQKEFSNGTMADKDKITKLRFEQMLRGLYITQNPIGI